MKSTFFVVCVFLPRHDPTHLLILRVAQSEKRQFESEYGGRVIQGRCS